MVRNAVERARGRSAGVDSRSIPLPPDRDRPV